MKVIKKIDHNFFAIQDILDNCIIIRDGVVMVEGPPKNIIKDNEIFTPFANSCLPGITRKMVLSIADNEGIANYEKDLSLTELYTSDEAFTSGTMGELTPVLEADGRIIGNGEVGELTKKMQSLHLKHAIENGTSLPFKKPD